MSAPLDEQRVQEQETWKMRVLSSEWPRQDQIQNVQIFTNATFDKLSNLFAHHLVVRVHSSHACVRVDVHDIIPTTVFTI